MYRNGVREIHGTARAQAMSNAVGALGADPTAVSINPAGIGLYRSSEFTLGFNFGNVKTSTNWQDKEGADMRKWVSNLDHLSIIFPIYNPHLFASNLRIVMGASINSLYDYDRDYEMRTIDPNYGLTEYLANRATREYDAEHRQLYDFLSQTAFGAEFIELDHNEGRDGIYRPGTYIAVDPTKSINEKYKPDNIEYLYPNSSKLNVSEKGRRKIYDLTLGGSLADKLYFGATLRTSSTAYSRFSMYHEDYSYSYKPTYDEPDQTYYAELGNGLTVEGATIGASFGLMAAVGDFGRVGISYNTPQFGRYNETFYTTTAWYNNNRIVTDNSGKERLEPLYKTETEDLTSSYNIMLSGDLTASAMVFLGGYGMVTYDFNWRNLGDARFRGENFSRTNKFIQEYYGSQMTHSVGIELRPLDGLYLRGGYSYSDGGLKATGLRPSEGNKLEYSYIPSGTITDTAIKDSYQSISAGLGYRLFGRTTIDLAYVRGKVRERVYSMPYSEGLSRTDGSIMRPEVTPIGAAMSTVTDRMVASLTFRF